MCVRIPSFDGVDDDDDYKLKRHQQKYRLTRPRSKICVPSVANFDCDDDDDHHHHYHNHQHHHHHHHLHDSQAGMFYFPRLLWKSAEGGVMKLLTAGNDHHGVEVHHDHLDHNDCHVHDHNDDNA